MLSPTSLPPARLIAPAALAETRPAPIEIAPNRRTTAPGGSTTGRPLPTASVTARAMAPVSATAPSTAPVSSAAPLTDAAEPPPGHAGDQMSLPPPFLPPAPLQRTTTSRLSGDAWLVVRPTGGDALAFGQLGASQGGGRLTFALDEQRHVALSARLSAPIRDRGREAGFGVDLRPTHWPIHLLVEERLSLDGGDAQPAVALIAGISTALPARMRLDAYAQGGAVRRRGAFVDGAAIVARPIVARGRTRLELGGGAWGAAQRGLSRLDLGPTVALVTPAGATALRLQLDYRVRLLGHARPGSGPALTLGGSF